MLTNQLASPPGCHNTTPAGRAIRRSVPEDPPQAGSTSVMIWELDACGVWWFLLFEDGQSKPSERWKWRTCAALLHLGMICHSFYQYNGKIHNLHGARHIKSKSQHGWPLFSIPICTPLPSLPITHFYYYPQHIQWNGLKGNVQVDRSLRNKTKYLGGVLFSA